MPYVLSFNMPNPVGSSIHPFTSYLFAVERPSFLNYTLKIMGPDLTWKP